MLNNRVLLGWRAISILALLFCTLGCQYSFLNLEYRRGESALRTEEYKKAVGFFDRVIRRDPESSLAVSAAEKAAHISVLYNKDYKAAIKFNKHIILYSRNETQRKQAQKNIAKIYYENLTDYKEALKAYNKIISLPHTKEEGVAYRMAVARSLFYLGNYYQSQVEVEQLLKQKLDDDHIFQASLFLGNIFFTVKKMDKAIKVFKGLLEKFPKKSHEEKVPMTIVVCYEELKDYDLAIKMLDQMKLSHDSPEFIELKIQRLKKRKANLPGYKGLKK